MANIIGIDTKIEVNVMSPTTWEAHQVVSDTTMTEIEVSISILSWCLKAYWIYADSGVYKQKIAHKLLQISHYGKHGYRPLSQQLP